MLFSKTLPELFQLCPADGQFILLIPPQHNIIPVIVSRDHLHHRVQVDEIALVNKAKLVISGNVDQIRKEHGHNRVEVCYRAETADGVMAADGGTGRLQSVEGLFSVFSTENTKNGLRSVLDICKDASSRNVLSEISRQVEIVSYQPLMPKMNEIFIKLVGESGGATSQSIEDYRKSDPKNR